MLTAIDRRRQRAWSSGDPTMLATVYTPGSAVLAADRRMLHAYAARGLLLSAVHMRYLSVAVRERAPGMVRLLVVDELAPLSVSAPGATALPLPRDLPTRQLITLRWSGREWRIAAVA